MNTVNTAEISDANFKTKYADKVRLGKTRKDRASNAFNRRMENHNERASYVQWCASSASNNSTTATASSHFPWKSCNGKKTRAMKSKMKV